MYIEDTQAIRDDDDFVPSSNLSRSHDVRIRSAVEYSACQLGKIRKALDRIAVAAERIAEKL
jgi:hypothetical protein